MATLTGANLLDSILQSTGVTLNTLLTATLTAKLQSMIDNGTDSNLAVSIAVSGFSTDISAATEVSALSDTVATNAGLIEAAEEGEVGDIVFPDYDGPAQQVFTLTPDAAAINEGSTLTFTVTASNPVEEDTVVTFEIIPTFLEGGVGTDVTDSDSGTTGTNLNDFDPGMLIATQTIAAGTTTATFTVTPSVDGFSEFSEDFSVKATVNGEEFMVDATVLDGASLGAPLLLTPSDDGSTMRLTGDQNVRIDFTDPTNQITGLDLDFDGVIEANGVENAVDVMPVSDFIIVDAYSRDLLNEENTTDNFLGDIQFDGTGWEGDGVNTDGAIFLGGLGNDTAYGGIGNDFLAGGVGGADNLFGGRNADFFFVSDQGLDGGELPNIDGGSTSDDAAVGNNTAQDSDWVLLEVSDDYEPFVVNLEATFTEVENLDASGNLYGFVNNIDVALGENGQLLETGENVGIGATAQLDVNGSAANNIIIGGFDNDDIDGAGGDDLIFGGRLDYNNNPNTQNIVNDGMDELRGGTGNDHIAFEADGGIADGEADTDTLWLTDLALGTGTLADLTTDSTLRMDLGVGAGDLDDYSGYGGADANSRWGATADQTNYQIDANPTTVNNLRTTVTNVENVIATGLNTAALFGAVDSRGDAVALTDLIQADGSLRADADGNLMTAEGLYVRMTVGGEQQFVTLFDVTKGVDYLAAGTNDPELNFNNQQNIGAFEGDLDLRGTNGANVLYANTGDDVIEGRRGDDLLSGGDGNDDFIFALDGDDAQDGVDVIHRQVDADDDNIWDGTFGQDFGLDRSVVTMDSVLQLAITRVGGNQAGDELGDVVNQVSEIRTGVMVDGAFVEVVLNTQEIKDARTYEDLEQAINDALGQTEFANELTAELQADGVTIFISDSQGRELADEFSEVSAGVDVSQKANTETANVFSFAEPDELVSQDRLIYASYEDRADGELRDDDSVLGSNISLGRDGYAEDLVISFSEDGTRIAEDQAYELEFDNLTTQDIVTITVNGVEYELQVGVDLDGNIINAEDGPGNTQPAIQAAFLARLTGFINTFMDDDTAAGQVNAALAGNTITLTQVDYNGEETVFMEEPVVEIQNLSGGEKATVGVTNTSEHEVHLFDFDGRDGNLNSDNVLFIGDTGINRATLETAENAGSVLQGKDAVLIDNAADDHAETVANTEQTVYNSQATNAQLDAQTEIYAVHGDDLLIGGDGNDTINGGTGDDRIVGSSGDDTVDGGKNFYAVQVLGESDVRVYELNTWESENPDEVAALDGLNITDITLIPQTENGTVTIDAFDDTLLFQQTDFEAGVTEFTVTLDDYQMNDGVVELQNDGAGTVAVDVDGDGVSESTTTFTNFENVRTVSGIGQAVADNGQGNDTLNVTGLSTDTGGISYDLTNTGNAGQVTYSQDATINAQALEAGELAAGRAGATLNSVVNAVLNAQTTVAFNAAVGAIPLTSGGNAISIGAFLTAVGALPELTRPTSQNDALTIAPNASDYETQVIRVDGVENVIAGSGDDLLLIDETEAAKNNLFEAGLGDDRIEYLNEYLDANGAVTVIAEPTVTIKVNTDSDQDQVVMTDGRLGTVEATDELNSVEYITLNENTAESDRADDVIDVTAMTDGAVVDYVTQEVRDLSGDVQVTIENMFRMENVWADGDDTVIVANNTTMRGNSNYDVAAADADDIILATFMDYDELDPDTNLRVAFDDQTSDQIQDVFNQELFSFDLSKTGDGNDTDTVDYSQAVDSIATVVQEGDFQYVLVDQRDALVDTFGNDDVARVDKLTGVEQIVASQGESILDFTSLEEEVQITFQFDESAVDEANDMIEHVVRIGDAAGDNIDGIPNYIERFDLDADADVPAFANAAWTRIEGGDYATSVFYDGSEDIEEMGGVDHRYTSDVLNLRGGDNNVSYYALETSITTVVNVTEFDAEDPGNTGLINATIEFQDGTDDMTGRLSNATHTITSYTSDNEIAAGNLKLEATQANRDSLQFTGDTTMLYILGTSPGVIDVSFQDLEVDTMRLTGFEFLQDAATDDVYDMKDLDNILGNVQLADAARPDHDTIKVYDDAIGYGNALADTISLTELNTELAFDFDVLDISAVTEGGLTIVGDTPPPAPNDDELVVGQLSLIDEITLFESMVLTDATVANGTEFILDIDAGVLSQGSTDVNYTGTGLSAGGLMFGTDDSYIDPVSTGVTITVEGDTATATRLYGGAGDDEITGGVGDDIIAGGAGDDTLEAGGDEVLNVFTVEVDGLATAAGTVTILGQTVNVEVNDGPDTVGALFAAIDAEDFTDGVTAAPVNVSYDAESNQLTFTFDYDASGEFTAALVDSSATAGIDFANPSEETAYELPGAGDDIIYGGAGIDAVDGGAGNDTFVVIGEVDNSADDDADDDYNTGDTAGSAAVNFQAAVEAIEGEDGQADSDVSTDTFDGGEDIDTLEVWGDADFRAATIEDIEIGHIHSEVTFTQAQIDGFTDFLGETGSVVNVLDEDGDITEFNYDDDLEDFFDADGNALIVTPTYTLASAAADIDEGEAPARFRVTTTNVDAGTVLNYRISGDVDADDIVGGQLEGTATVDDNGIAMFTVSLVADESTDEGPETLTVTLVEDETATVDVTVNDTSISGYTEESADIGTATVPASLDAAADGFKFTDDATVLTNVVIDNFTADDVIEVTNADESDYNFTSNGTDVSISFTNEGTVNQIVLAGVLTAPTFIDSQASFEAAIGFDAFTVVA